MRRTALSLLLMGILLLPTLLADPGIAKAQTVEVFKTTSCFCCTLWMRHMMRSGFSTKWKDLSDADLAQFKTQALVPKKLQTCLTAKIGGYVIEGHVPASDIRRLLAERPDAIGLAVPGMPIGSPGMESGNQREPYDVLLIRRDGTTEVFSSH